MSSLFSCTSGFNPGSGSLGPASRSPWDRSAAGGPLTTLPEGQESPEMHRRPNPRSQSCSGTNFIKAPNTELTT